MTIEFPVKNGRIEGVRIVDAFGAFGEDSTPTMTSPIYVDEHCYEMWLLKDHGATVTFQHPMDAEIRPSTRPLFVLSPDSEDGFEMVSEIYPALYKHCFVALGKRDRDLVPHLHCLQRQPLLLRPWISMSTHRPQEVHLVYAHEDALLDLCSAIAHVLRAQLLKECSTPGWAHAQRRSVSRKMAYHLHRSSRSEEDTALAAAVIRKSGFHSTSWKTALTGGGVEPTEEQEKLLEQAEKKLASPMYLG
jgi:hypothetical protein